MDRAKPIDLGDCRSRLLRLLGCVRGHRLHAKARLAQGHGPGTPPGWPARRSAIILAAAAATRSSPITTGMMGDGTPRQAMPWSLRPVRSVLDTSRSWARRASPSDERTMRSAVLTTAHCTGDSVLEHVRAARLPRDPMFDGRAVGGHEAAVGSEGLEAAHDHIDLAQHVLQAQRARCRPAP